MTKSASYYFSRSFAEAREKIVNAFDASGGRIISFALPGLTGPDGGLLTTDVAWFGPDDAQTVHLTTTGLHGAENPAGSAILFKTLDEGGIGQLPPGTAAVMAHALNPYGAAHIHRVNENNVDMNRNFIDWDAPPPADHPMAAQVYPILTPEKWCWPLILAKAAPVILTKGISGLQQTLQQGQYSFPDNIFYGGDKPQWTNHLMQQVTDGLLVHGKKIAHLDIHTGLGKFGAAEIIIDRSPESGEGRRALSWWGDDVRSTKSGKSVSAKVSGSIFDVFNKAAVDVKLTRGALEFGTRNRFAVLKALAFDNWVRATGQTERYGEQARGLMSDAFNPADPAWQDAVLERGVTAWHQARTGLARGPL